MGRGWLIGVTLATGCSCGEGGKPTDSGMSGADCGNYALIGTVPDDGTTDAYPYTLVSVTLGGPIDAAEFTVTGPAGAVTGATQVNSQALWFEPDEPLAPGAYTVDWSATCPDGSVRAESFGFSVDAAECAASVDAASLVGRSWVLHLPGGSFIQPPNGMADALDGTLEYDLLIGVDSVDANGDLVLIGAVSTTLGGSEGVQQECAPSIEFAQVASFAASNPYFTVSTDLLPIEVDGSRVEVAALTLSGCVSSDGSAVEHGQLFGFLDARPLGEALADTGETPDPAAACDLFRDTYAIFCEECSPTFDAGPYCVTLQAVEYTLPESAAGALVERTEGDLPPECTE
jgi:methionine-rich copper-binding protein CopC